MVQLNAADLGRFGIPRLIYSVVREGVWAIFFDRNADIRARCNPLGSTIDGVADLPDAAAAIIVAAIIIATITSC